MAKRNSYFQVNYDDGTGGDVYMIAGADGLTAMQVAEMFFAEYWPVPHKFQKVTLKGIRAYERAWDTTIPIHPVYMYHDMDTNKPLFDTLW